MQLSKILVYGKRGGLFPLLESLFPVGKIWAGLLCGFKGHDMFSCLSWSNRHYAKNDVITASKKKKAILDQNPSDLPDFMMIEFPAIILAVDKVLILKI